MKLSLLDLPRVFRDQAAGYPNPQLDGAQFLACANMLEAALAQRAQPVGWCGLCEEPLADGHVHPESQWEEAGRAKTAAPTRCGLNGCAYDAGHEGTCWHPDWHTEPTLDELRGLGPKLLDFEFANASAAPIPTDEMIEAEATRRWEHEPGWQANDDAWHAGVALATWARDFRAPMPTREQIDALPTIVPLYMHDEYVKRDDVLALFRAEAKPPNEDDLDKFIARMAPGTFENWWDTQINERLLGS